MSSHLYINVLKEKIKAGKKTAGAWVQMALIG